MNVHITPPRRIQPVEDGDIELRPLSRAIILPEPVTDAGYLSDGAADEDVAPAEPEPASPVYLTGIYLFLVAAASTLAIFLTMLDTSIVATAVCGPC